jgi:O-antigen/teichoic acid export membrane protein
MQKMIEQSGIVSRILKSIGADALGQFLNVLTKLLLVPIFLKFWGAELYGEWLILFAWCSWFTIADLGGQLFFANKLTADWAKGELVTFRKTFSSGLFLFSVTSLALLVLLGLGIIFLPLGKLINLKNINHDELSFILLIIAARFSISLPVGLLMAVYRAIGLQGRSIMCSNWVLVTQSVFTAMALWMGAGVLTIGLIELLPFLAIIFFIRFDLSKKLPLGYKLFSFGDINLALIKNSIAPSLYFFGIQMGYAAIIQGTIIVLSRVLSPIEVSIFSSIRIIANVMSRFMGILIHAVWPEVTRLYESKDISSLSGIFRLIQYSGVYFGFIYILIVIYFGDSLFNFWLAGRLNYSFWAGFFLSAHVVLNGIWITGGSFLMASNLHKKYSLAQFPINFFALALTYFGAINWGLCGGIVGTLIGQFLPMAFIVHKLLLEEKFVSMASTQIQITLVMICCLPLLFNPWSGLLLMLVLSIILINEFKKIKLRLAF